MLKKIKFISNCNLLSISMCNNIKIMSLPSLILARLNYKNLRKYYIFKYLTFNFNWLRLTWRGKTYIVYFFQKKNLYSFRFGFSHWSRLKYTNTYYSCKFARQSYLFYSIGYKSFKVLRKLIKFIKLINKYTKRGLRLKKQAFVRRFGKISQANSIFANY